MTRIEWQAIKRDKWLPILAFFIALLLHVVWNHNLIMPSSVTDEVGTMSSAAYLAGYQWIDALGNQNYYYAFGSAWYLAPVFMLFKDPVVIYYILRLVLGVISSIPTLIAYRLMRKQYGVTSKPLLFAGSIVCSIFTSNTSFSFISEPTLILFVWIVFYLIVALQNNIDNYQKRSMLTILLSLALVYSLIVHTRAIIYIIAAAVVIIAYSIYNKRALIDFYVAIPMVFLGYFAADNVVNTVQETIFGRPDYMHNSSEYLATQLTGSVPEQIREFGRRVSLKGFFDLLGSNLFASITFSVGFLIVAVWVFLFLMGKISIKRFRDKDTDHLKSILFPTMFCVAGGAISLLGFCVMYIWHGIWLNAGHAIHSDGRFFFYLRYFINFMGPLFLLLVVQFFNAPQDLKKIFLCTVATIGIVWAYFELSIVGTMRRYSIEGFDVIGTFSAWLLRDPYSEEPFKLWYYSAAMLLAVLAMCGVFLLVRFKKPVIAVTVLGCLLFYQQSAEVLRYRKPIVEQSYDHYNGIHTFYIANPALLDEIDTIYTYSTQTYRIHLPLQLLYFDKTVVPGLPGELEEPDRTVLLSNDELELVDYYVAMLDDNEYLYVNSELLLEQYSSLGLEFEKVKFKPYELTVTAERWRLRYTGDAIYDEELDEIQIRRDGVQYGPYMTLGEGTYYVTIHGSGLLRSTNMITADSGTVEIPFEVIEREDDTIILAFTIEETTKEVEIVTGHRGSGYSAVSLIELDKVQEEA